MSHSAIFLDLNGTLVMPVQVSSPREYHLIEGSVEAVSLLNQAGFLCPVVTVQSRIEKGIYSEQSFLNWFRQLQDQLKASNATILGPYLCPHSSKTMCNCRKPQPTLYMQAAQECGINCKRSYVVGDTANDIRAGKAIGAKPCFVRTGWAARDIAQFGHEAAFIGDDILQVAQWIVHDAANSIASPVLLPER
ncbi:MAG: HAD-IIIA family hydrolase [Anaerolineae bacterium]|nr:HAD-IIIA family hydrolase [Anaerolineae bacterium]